MSDVTRMVKPYLHMDALVSVEQQRWKRTSRFPRNSLFLAFKLLRWIDAALVQDAVDAVTEKLGHDVGAAAQCDGASNRGFAGHDEE